MYIIWNKKANRPATKEESDIIVNSYISEDDNVEITWSSSINTLDGTIYERDEAVKYHKQYEVRRMAEYSDENAVSPIQNISFSEGDIVEFTTRRGEPKRGYITMHNGSLSIRCPHPYYEYHPIYDNTVLIKKGGWKN